VSDEQPNTSSSASRALPKLWDAYKVTVTEERELMKRARPAMGTPRLIYFGALVGVCVVFLASLAPSSHLDTPLAVAVYAFVAAIALLILGFAAYYYQFPSGQGKREALRAAAMDRSFGPICELGGLIAVVLGISAVVWHLNGWALLVGYGTLILAFLVATGLTALYEERHQADLANPPAHDTPRR
jgi:cobalamin synthase